MRILPDPESFFFFQFLLVLYSVTYIYVLELTGRLTENEFPSQIDLTNRMILCIFGNFLHFCCPLLTIYVWKLLDLLKKKSQKNSSNVHSALDPVTNLEHQSFLFFGSSNSTYLRGNLININLLVNTYHFYSSTKRKHEFTKLMTSLLWKIEDTFTN